MSSPAAMLPSPRVKTVRRRIDLFDLCPGSRWTAFAGLAVLAMFLPQLIAFAQFAWRNENQSHALLIPLISIYLGWQNRKSWRKEKQTRSTAPLVFLGLALISELMVVLLEIERVPIPLNDLFSAHVTGFYCATLAILVLAFGREMLRAFAFPLAFALFSIPLPMAVLDAIEMLLQHGSATVFAAFVHVSGVPVFREELTFALPGMLIQIAPECSGSRSSLVLFITSLLAGYLFLRTPKHRTLLALAVIPVGILRNAIRIFLLTMLSLYVDPRLIHGPAHTAGGPPFFVLSLIPLFLLVVWFRRRENRDYLFRRSVPRANVASTAAALPRGS
jgi:exosortase C (VPDSG-CTERM-specific)